MTQGHAVFYIVKTLHDCFQVWRAPESMLRQHRSSVPPPTPPGGWATAVQDAMSAGEELVRRQQAAAASGSAPALPMPDAGTGQVLPATAAGNVPALQGPPARPAVLDLDASHIKSVAAEQRAAPGPLVPLLAQQTAAAAAGGPAAAAEDPTATLAITDGSGPLNDGSIKVPTALQSALLRLLWCHPEWLPNASTTHCRKGLSRGRAWVCEDSCIIFGIHEVNRMLVRMSVLLGADHQRMNHAAWEETSHSHSSKNFLRPRTGAGHQVPGPAGHAHDGAEHRAPRPPGRAPAARALHVQLRRLCHSPGAPNPSFGRLHAWL